jgi:tRNA threonylcarbamoyladenosine biosynthesis protein TsaB
MLILTLRSDKPEAEIGLFNDRAQIAYISWQADRQLAETIHEKLQAVLKAHSYNLHDVKAVAVYKGPGSFTGLRIGISVANALAEGLQVPIVATAGNNWRIQALKQLGKGANEHSVVPKYGSPPHITTQKK